MTRSHHTALAAIGSLAAALAMAGCQSSDTGSTATSTSSSNAAAGAGSSTTSGSASAANVTLLTITIKGKQVTPTPADHEVPPGRTVRLVVTSDHDDELHAHGFNKEVPLKAGQPTTLDPHDHPTRHLRGRDP